MTNPHKNKMNKSDHGKRIMTKLSDYGKRVVKKMIVSTVLILLALTLTLHYCGVITGRVGVRIAAMLNRVLKFCE